MLVPMVFVDFMSHMTARWLTYNRLSLLAIANSKEINIRELNDNRGLRPDMKLDLDTATRKLTFLNDEYAITESISKTQLRFLALIEEIVEQGRLPFVEGQTTRMGTSELLIDEITFMREAFKSALQNIERDRQNIQGLAQTVYEPSVCQGEIANRFITDILPHCAKRKSPESGDCQSIQQNSR